LFLVQLCLRRQAQARIMVILALMLLGFLTAFVAMLTARGSGRVGLAGQLAGATPQGSASAAQRRSTAGGAVSPGPRLAALAPESNLAQALLGAAIRARQERAAFLAFANVVIFALFISFLLPLQSLSFATAEHGKAASSAPSAQATPRRTGPVIAGVAAWVARARALGSRCRALPWQN